MVHTAARIAERQIPVTVGEMVSIARSCRCDTAVVLGHVESHRVMDGWLGSNGDLVVLIVRECRPVTIMYRRSNQPLTAQALRVDEVIDRSH